MIQKTIIAFAIIFAIPCVILTQPQEAVDVDNAAENFDAEVDTINALTKVVSEFSDSMDTAETPEDYMSACEALTEGLEVYGKAIQNTMKAHPDWAKEPPTEIDDAINNYIAESDRYSKALKIILDYANSHTEDMAFQEAFGRLNRAM
jgi:hypothetical protein